MIILKTNQAKVFLTVILTLALSSGIYAQNPQKNKTESDRLVKLFQQLEGTYQVQIINSRDKTEIPLGIMDSIVAKRHNNQVVYFSIKNNVRVMVLPFSVINGKDFKPLDGIANIFIEK